MFWLFLAFLSVIFIFKVSKNTQIVFCTYGVLLRVLQEDADLAAIDFLLLDEIHERGIDSDFTLALLLLAAQRRRHTSHPLKLIIMSATISTEKFAKYVSDTLSLPTPVLEIPGLTFPVRDFFKQQFEEVVRYHLFNSLKSEKGKIIFVF